MKRSCNVVLFVILLAPIVFAKTVYVGTCHSPSYGTISAAVAAATAGDTIDVCPGTYPEQVFINQQLTIQGITSAGGDLARIVVPNIVGNQTNWRFVTDPLSGSTVAPQVFVNIPAGTVKLTNLTIDGTGEIGAYACLYPGYWFTLGIYSNSSVNINEVTTIGQGQNNGCGVGILAEAYPADNSVTITHSSVLNPSFRGIELEGGGSVGLGGSVTISMTHNTVQMPPASVKWGEGSALFSNAVSGEISSNTFWSQGWGIWDVLTTGPLTISGNTLIGPGPLAGTGINNGGTSSPNVGPETYSNNTIVNFGYGFAIPKSVGSVTVKNNSVVNSGTGMAFASCTGWTLSGNSINNTNYGFYNIPSSFSPTSSQVSLYNVGQFVQSTMSCP